MLMSEDGDRKAGKKGTKVREGNKEREEIGKHKWWRNEKKKENIGRRKQSEDGRGRVKGRERSGKVGREEKVRRGGKRGWRGGKKVT